jgi:hypothetical protein
MIDPVHMLEFVIIPTLKWIDLDNIAARSLVLGTGLAESNLTYLNQLGSPTIGPALGIYQMEKATYDDIWSNFLFYRKTLGDKIRWLKASYPDSDAWLQLPTNLALATAMCRIQYYRRREPLPDPSDIVGMADYWKAHYNTRLGRGIATSGHFAQAVSVVMAHQRRTQSQTPIA